MRQKDFQEPMAQRNKVDSFAVCSLVREPLPIIQYFVEHYRQTGAEKMFLFYDGSEGEAEEVCNAFHDDDFVSITVCDTSYWQTMYPDEEVLSLRHKLTGAFKHGMQLNTLDWILFCDCDEFVVGEAPLGQALAQLPAKWKGTRLNNTEAVWGVDDDIDVAYGCSFERHPFPSSFAGKFIYPFLVYGKNWRFLQRGTAGHVVGKHLLRKGIVPDSMTSHVSFFNGKKVRRIPKEVRNELNLRIIHYDAISHLRWRDKWRSRLGGHTNSQHLGKARVLQREKVRGALENGTDAKLFRQYYGLNRWQQFVLQRLGLLTRIDK